MKTLSFLVTFRVGKSILCATAGSSINWVNPPIFLLTRLMNYSNMTIKNTSRKRRRGGVHTHHISREKMFGENLHDESMEVAFELWTQRLQWLY